MSWKEAKAEAVRRIAVLPIPQDGDLSGLTVTVTQYEDEAALLFDGHQERHTWHIMVNTSIRRILRKRGAWVKFRTVAITDLMIGDPSFVGKRKEFLKAKKLEDAKLQAESEQDTVSRRAELDKLKELGFDVDWQGKIVLGTPVAKAAVKVCEPRKVK